MTAGEGGTHVRLSALRGDEPTTEAHTHKHHGEEESVGQSTARQTQPVVKFLAFLRPQQPRSQPASQSVVRTWRGDGSECGEHKKALSPVPVTNTRDYVFAILWQLVARLFCRRRNKKMEKSFIRHELLVPGCVRVWGCRMWPGGDR